MGCTRQVIPAPRIKFKDSCDQNDLYGTLRKSLLYTVCNWLSEKGLLVRKASPSRSLENAPELHCLGSNPLDSTRKVSLSLVNLTLTRHLTLAQPLCHSFLIWEVVMTTSTSQGC
jgi:hypothetical protein